MPLLFKVLVDTHNMMKKRRLNALNSTVCSAVENYSCEAAAIPILSDGIGEAFGISKQEVKVSKRHLFNGFRGLVDGS